VTLRSHMRGGIDHRDSGTKTSHLFNALVMEAFRYLPGYPVPRLPPPQSGAVWQSPTTGDIIAGDTFLRLNGNWLDTHPSADVTLTLDTSHRREGESWAEGNL